MTRYRFPFVVLLLLMLLGLTACARHQVAVAPLDGVYSRVAARHDAYVADAPGLDDALRTVRLEESAKVAERIAAAREAGETYLDGRKIAAAVNRVTLRHDGYVLNDASLDEQARKIYLQSSMLLRRLFGEIQPSFAPDSEP